MHITISDITISIFYLKQVMLLFVPKSDAENGKRAKRFQKYMLHYLSFFIRKKYCMVVKGLEDNKILQKLWRKVSLKEGIVNK